MLTEACICLPYAEREVQPPVVEDLLGLWRRALPSSSWTRVAGNVQHLGWNWFEVEGLTTLSDWAIASQHVFLPLVLR